MQKKTLVLGASTNPERYSHIAIRRLRSYLHPVVSIGLRPGQVADVEIDTGEKPYTDIDTITLYLNPARQQAYYDYILSLRPNRIIFNPGTENEALVRLAESNRIATIEACTLVLLSTGQY